MAMRRPGDTKKAESYMHLLEGVNTDILLYNDVDADGNIGLSGVILPRTAFPEGENITNKRAITKTKAWVKMSTRIESLTDPGGINGYKSAESSSRSRV